MKIGYDREQSEEYGKKYGAIILAAGLSSRMKEFKPLLHVAGMTAIEGLIESARVAGLDDITVVTGHNREALAPIIAATGVREAYNADYESGMFSSVKSGLAAQDGSKEGYLLMPVDCPLISARVMRAVMAAGANAPFAVATFEGKKGHPLLIPAQCVSEILEHDGEGGLAAVTDRYAEEMIRVPVDEEGCILDMDTPEGYEDIKAFVAKGFAREKLELLTARKRIFLVRHGETQQHDEPMFIGQYDVSLSDEGRAQAKNLGREIAAAMAEDVEAERLGMDRFGKEPMPSIERIYSSDLGRAVETAEIIKEEVNALLAGGAGFDGPNPVDVKCDPGLREINLGPWDGRPISEIKEKYPEEYERRGRNIFTFKMRGGAENFYDMQYRVLAAFREILRNDDAKDIIVVTHSGVIRALENNILGKRVDDEWEPLAKGEFRMLTPFPEQPSEKAGDKDKPMTSDSLTMEAVLEYYE